MRPRAGDEDDPLEARGAAHRGRACRRSTRCPPRLDSRYVFTTTRKVPGLGEPGPFDVANFRRRVWGPAIDAAGIAKPARLYDLRSTFASNALAAGITMFELARIMGTSAKMIEQHYGTLIDTAHDAIVGRLELL